MTTALPFIELLGISIVGGLELGASTMTHEPDDKAKLAELTALVRAAIARLRDHDRLVPNDAMCVMPQLCALIAYVDPPKPPEPKFKSGERVAMIIQEHAYLLSDDDHTFRHRYKIGGCWYDESELRLLTDAEIGPRP